MQSFSVTSQWIDLFFFANYFDFLKNLMHEVHPSAAQATKMSRWLSSQEISALFLSKIKKMDVLVVSQKLI